MLTVCCSDGVLKLPMLTKIPGLVPTADGWLEFENLRTILIYNRQLGIQPWTLCLVLFVQAMPLKPQCKSGYHFVEKILVPI